MLAEAEPKPRRRRNESACGAPVARFAAWVGPFRFSFLPHGAFPEGEPTSILCRSIPFNGRATEHWNSS